MKGLTPGAAMVFLMTGPATNAASLVTIWKVLGHRTAVTYLLTVAGCAIAAGLLLDSLVTTTDLGIVSKTGWMLHPIIKNASAVILLVVVGWDLFRLKKSDEPHH